MRKTLLSLVTALALVHPAHAATPADTLVVAVPLDGIISFDPAESFETVSNSSLRNIYQTLLEPDHQNPQKLSPLAATRWQAGKTPHSLVFDLNPQAHFASGHPLTAQDVVFSLTRAVRLNKAPSFILGEFGWTPENIDQQFTVINDHQFELRWPAEIGSDLALRLLTAPVASIVDSKLAQEHASSNDYGNAWLKNHSAGSAAYAIKQFVPLQALVLEANPHSTQKPHLKRVLLKGVADPGSRRLLLQQGDVDVACQLGPDQIAALRNTANVRVDAFPSSLIYYLGFNTQSPQQPALGNPALWQAARWLAG
jgi:peptide/nickel transport system substrate-binding protein